MPGTGFAFERADDVGRDPAAVEAAGLRHDPFAVNETFNSGGIESDVVLQHRVTRAWPRVAPRDGRVGIGGERPVLRRAFPLAYGTAGRLDELVPEDVVVWQIERRRTRRFHEAVTA